MNRARQFITDLAVFVFCVVSWFLAGIVAALFIGGARVRW